MMFVPSVSRYMNTAASRPSPPPTSTLHTAGPYFTPMLVIFEFVDFEFVAGGAGVVAVVLAGVLVTIVVVTVVLVTVRVGVVVVVATVRVLVTVEGAGALLAVLALAA
jgi:hypothetical protein